MLEMACAYNVPSEVHGWLFRLHLKVILMFLNYCICIIDDLLFGIFRMSGQFLQQVLFIVVCLSALL